MWFVNGLLNFLPQFWLVMLLPLMLALPFRRHRVTLLSAAPFAAVLLVMGGARTLSADGQACEAPTLRVATANVLMSNDRLPELARDILDQAPDVVVFEELRHDLEDFSPELALAYPYRISTATRWMTLASRLPLEDARRLTLEVDAPGREPLAAEVRVGGQTVTVLAVHAQPPLSASTYRLHQQQYARLAEEAQAAEGPVIALGDFNATVFSPLFARFVWSNGLRVASDNEPTHFPRRNLGLRIDHVLVRDVGVCEERVFDLTGSDHRGVAVGVHIG
ncbi:MAG: endonuclease/exonuclease/phosphatase family protein [Dehalococcoidia bacterium]